MLRGIERALWASLLCMVWLTGCSAALVPVPTPVPGLVVTLLYPHPDTEWVVFYAPEVDKTYLIGSTVTLPPAGSDPHAALRESFEVHPEVHASGAAPEPLPDLLPGPELVGPPLGARFTGTDQPIVLQ